MNYQEPAPYEYEAHSTWTARHTACVILGVLVLLCAIGAVAAMFLDYPSSVKRLLFMAASTGFVGLAVLAGAFKTWYGRGVLAGLFFCWQGDFLGPANFMVGLGMFLVAHLFLLVAFCTHGVEWKRALGTAAFFLPAAAALYFFYLAPHLSQDEVPFVAAYLLVITAMVIFAGGTRFESGKIFVFAAAVVFLVSDIFVARWKFVSKESINALFCYPMYYTACTMFALSILYHEEE
jgi:uncharacterized membrane protein YhhN